MIGPRFAEVGLQPRQFDPAAGALCPLRRRTARAAPPCDEICVMPSTQAINSDKEKGKRREKKMEHRVLNYDKAEAVYF